MRKMLQQDDYIVWTNFGRHVALEIENGKVIISSDNEEVTLSKEMLEVILPYVNKFYKTGKLF